MKVLERVKADESKLARYSRAVALWASALALQAIQSGGGPDAVEHWTVKRWVIGLGVSALMGVAGLISVGQKNPAAAAPPTPPAAGVARLALLPLLVALTLLAACAAAPCVCRPSDLPPLTRAEVQAWAGVSPERETALAAQRAELDRIVAANHPRGGEIP